MKLIPEQVYVYTKKDKLVVFRWMSRDDKYAMVHPLGEPDMQSMFGIPPSELSEQRKIILEKAYCFSCNKELQVRRNEDGLAIELVHGFGLFFISHGNYGSRIYDPNLIPGKLLEFIKIIICDECVKKKANLVDRVKIQHQRDRHVVTKFDSYETECDRAVKAWQRIQKAPTEKAWQSIPESPEAEIGAAPDFESGD